MVLTHPFNSGTGKDWHFHFPFLSSTSDLGRQSGEVGSGPTKQHCKTSVIKAGGEGDRHGVHRTLGTTQNTQWAIEVAC